MVLTNLLGMCKHNFMHVLSNIYVLLTGIELQKDLSSIRDIRRTTEL